MSAILIPVIPATASAAGFKNCGSVKASGLVLATKVQAKGLSCGDAAAFWTSYVSTGEVLPPDLEALRTKCKEGPKAAKKKAAKKNRMAYICGSGKIMTKAWVLGG